MITKHIFALGCIFLFKKKCGHRRKRRLLLSVSAQ
jgi:hypothetical protein